MNFSHTEIRQMLQDTISRVIQNEYAIEKRNDFASSNDGYSKKHWQLFSELGVVGALFQEQDGGFGGSGFDIVALFESLGAGLVVEPFVATAIQAGELLSQAGNDVQKALINELINGETMMSFGHYEPKSRYQLSEISTSATKNEQGWILNGTKSALLNANSADFLIVSARTSGDVFAESGISLFLLDISKTTGLRLRHSATNDGGKLSEIEFDHVQLDSEALLGKEGQAFPIIEKTISKSILAVCAEAIGIMDAAKNQTRTYLQTRQQFGRPIGQFQVLQHKMAEQLVEIENIRSAVINAAAAFDGERVAREKSISAVKYLVGSKGRSIAEAFIQMHGGMGMTWEMPISHYCKRLIMIDHVFGDSDFHLQRYTTLADA